MVESVTNVDKLRSHLEHSRMNLNKSQIYLNNRFNMSFLVHYQLTFRLGVACANELDEQLCARQYCIDDFRAANRILLHSLSLISRDNDRYIAQWHRQNSTELSNGTNQNNDYCIKSSELFSAFFLQIFVDVCCSQQIINNNNELFAVNEINLRSFCPTFNFSAFETITKTFGNGMNEKRAHVDHFGSLITFCFLFFVFLNQPYQFTQLKYAKSAVSSLLLVSLCLA